MYTYEDYWKVESKIYERNGIKIYIVNNKLSDEKYIIKTGGVDDEIFMIRRYGNLLVNSPYLKLSLDNKLTHWDSNWFIMNLYNCNLSQCIEYGYKNINTLVENVLDSLCAIHTLNPPLVHMDIKIQNILVDMLDCKFILSDYELLDEVEDYSFELSKEVDDKKLYYLGRGVRIDDNLVSIKSDLLCFGNVLWRVLDGMELIRLEELTEKMRKARIDTDIESVVRIQNMIYDNIPEELVDYYEIVFDSDFSESLDREYYERLKKCLIKGINKCQKEYHE